MTPIHFTDVDLWHQWKQNVYKVLFSKRRPIASFLFFLFHAYSSLMSVFDKELKYAMYIEVCKMYAHTDMESVNYFCYDCTTTVKTKPSFLSFVSSLASVFMGLCSIFVTHHKVFFKVAWGVYCSNNRHSGILRFIYFNTFDRVAYLVAVVGESNQIIFHFS